MTNNRGKTTSSAPPPDEDSKKYRDRPADEGKHGDAADEPNSGVPTPSPEARGRPTTSSSRQQTNSGQVTQTGSPDIDGDKSVSHGGKRHAGYLAEPINTTGAPTPIIGAASSGF